MSAHLSLIVPAFNEARRLPPTLERLAAFVRECGFSVEVFIVVEQSADATLDIATRFAAKHGFEAIDSGVQRGKGHAVRVGMLRAQGEFVFYMDADLSVPLDEVHAFLRRFAEEPRVAVLIGDRQHARSRIVRRQSALRERMGQTFNRILQACAVAELRDTQCGFKAFRGEACREIFRRQTLDGFAFDVEVLLLAERLGFRIEAMPVEWTNSAESKVRIVGDSVRMLRDALRVRCVVEKTMRGELRPFPRALPRL